MIDLAKHGLIAPDTEPARPAGPGTAARLLDAMLEETPERLALVGRSARYTVAELDNAANRAANALRSLGVKPGDRVAASLPNDADIVVLFLAAMRLGAIWVGINRPLAAPEKAYMLSDAGVRVLLGDSIACTQIEPLRGDLPQLNELVKVDPGSADDVWGGLLADSDDDPVDVAIDPFTPGAIAYTSGTTGFPKGAVHTQHNMLMPGAVSAFFGSYTEGAVLGVALPLTILNLMILGPAAAYQNGITLVAIDRVDAVGLAEWIENEKISTFAAVPAMVHDLLSHPDVDQSQLASLSGIGVGGADMPDAFRRMYRERFKAPVGTGYGLTEAPTAVTVEDPTIEPVANTCGKALPQVQIHILDEDDNELGVGDVGEVCVGPAEEGPFADMYRPMLGYWNRAEATAVALRNGLLHTGDMGMVDDDGNLYIKDRRNDLIIRGGANVYPAEVERVLHESPDVQACAVIGSPDDRLGERVIAFVQLAGGANADPNELRAVCAAHLALYKVPDEITFVPEFDLTPMGKIRKGPLRDSLASA
jgi:long-chain acyl-CoA synthetase